MPEPSISRIVHYVSYGTPGGEYKPACRAAVVTEVDTIPAPTAADEAQTAIGLCVLNPTGLFFNQGVTEDQGTDAGPNSGSPLCGGRVYHGGSWHWPERVG